MTTNNIDKSIADNFPFYSDNEQLLLKELVVQSDPKSNNFQAAKNNFLELV